MGDAAEKKPKVYGAGVTPYGMYMMAQNYRASADALENAIIRPHVSDHPRRLLYLQALEHFLRSFLRLNSQDPEQIRAYRHDFGAMLDCCKLYGLQIPADAEAFIRSSALKNDYVRIRYEHSIEEPSDEDDPEPPSTLPLEKAVYALETAVGHAIERTGRQVFKRPVPADW